MPLAHKGLAWPSSSRVAFRTGYDVFRAVKEPIGPVHGHRYLGLDDARPVKFSWANLELGEDMDWSNLAGRARSQLHSMCTDAPSHGGFKMVAALLSMLLVASAYSQLSNLHVFGHDEVHYNHYFQLKLLQDGRWLNYIDRKSVV